LSALARLVLITDPSFSPAHTDRVIAAVAAAVPRGAFAVQLRDKQATPEAFRARALVLRELTRSLGVELFVNGSAEVARDVGADGVHVPGGSSIAEARRILGAEGHVSAAAHDDDDVRRALAEGADAVLVSPVFPTPGKGAPRGLGAIASACAIAAASESQRPLAVFALGGIDGENAKLCFEAGAWGVALIRALLAAADPAVVAMAILR
jgi:thiamine-phosphate pyrophosphorylase